MKKSSATLIAATFASLLATVSLLAPVGATTAVKESAPAACSTSSFKPEQFEVAIDRASGITFVHTPCGWDYMGIVKPESIEEGIAMAKAKPVPASVLAAEITLRPWLATYRSKLASR